MTRTGIMEVFLKIGLRFSHCIGIKHNNKETESWGRLSRLVTNFGYVRRPLCDEVPLYNV